MNRTEGKPTIVESSTEQDVRQIAQQEVDRALKHYATKADLLALQVRLIVGIPTVLSAIAGLALAANKIWS